MTDIRLGQSISASFSSTDTKNQNATSLFNGAYYDEYNLSGVDSFRQLNITVQRPQGTTSSTILELIDIATGEIIATTSHDGAGAFTLSETTFPGINYKLRLLNASFGDYQLSLTDGGKATSIVSPHTPNPLDGNTNSLVGTIGQSGQYYSLASGGAVNLTDIALAPNGQFYGVGATNTAGVVDLLYRIDPSLDRSQQVKLVGEIKDAQGNKLSTGIQSLEFAADNKLYALGYANEGAKFYQIDTTTYVATTLATLPQGLLIAGDLVYDGANQRFLATSLDAGNTSNDALWQIPLTQSLGTSIANPANATKIGMTGFTDVYGLNIENGQLFGYTAHVVPGATGATRIKIDPTTGKGTFDRAITGTQTFGIGGAATIFNSANDGLVLNVVNLAQNSLNQVIGTKSQGLAEGCTIDLSDYSGQNIKADLSTTSSAAYKNNIGFYVVEDAIGTIKLADGSSLKPGDANYAVEAIKNVLLQATQTDHQVGQNLLGGKIYAPVVVAQGTLSDFVSKNPSNGGDASAIHAYFNFIGANSDKTDHFRVLGNNIFGVEDMHGGGDRDYNDLVVNMNLVK
jgi:Domain of unknown function (DUF4114)